MAERPQKISIAFHGGQVLAARATPDEVVRLRGALSSGGWHELTAEDGTILLDVARVDYLLLETDEHRVGF